MRTAAFASILEPFAKAKSEREVFEAGRDGVKTSAGRNALAGERPPQDRMIDLLAGTARIGFLRRPYATGGGHDPHLRSAAAHFARPTFSHLVDQSGEPAPRRESEQGADRKGRGAHRRNPTAARVAEQRRKNALAFGYWPEKHIELQRKLNLRAADRPRRRAIPKSWTKSAACWRPSCAIRWWA